MSRVVLINPPPLRDNTSREYSVTAEIYFSIRDKNSPQRGDQQDEPCGGILSLGTALEHAMFDVELHDLNILYVRNPSLFDDEKINTTIEGCLRKSIEDCSFVGISSITLTARSAIRLSNLIKSWNPDVFISIGGIFPTVNPSYFLKEKSIDSVILGQAHEVYPRLLSSINSGSVIPKGVLLRKDIALEASDHSFEIPMTLPPYPGFHLLKEYCKPKTFRFISAFGCSHKCSFCSPALFYGDKVRYRIPKEFVATLRSTLKRYGLDSYLMGDLTFFNSIEHSTEVCKCIKELKVDDIAGYWCQTRLDLLSTDVINLLERSGCKQVALGIETFKQNTLSHLKEMENIRDIEHKFKELKKRKIEVQIYLMVGIPGETASDINRTIEKVRSLLEKDLLNHVNVGIYVPFPGLEIPKNVTIVDVDTQNYAMSVYNSQWPFPVYETPELTRYQIRDLWELSLSTYMKYI